MFIATMIMRLFLSVILIRATLHKLRDHKKFQAELNAYQLLPVSLLTPAVFLLISLEAFTSVTLLNPAWIFPVLVAALLFFIYALAMAINLFRGRTYIDCGCTRTRKTISWSLVTRNLILAAFALFCSATIEAHNTGSLEMFIIFAGATVSLLLYETIEQAISNTQGYRQWKH